MAYQPMPPHGLVSRFGATDACNNALCERRWPQGWSCPKCGVTRGAVFEQLQILLPKLSLGIHLTTGKQGVPGPKRELCDGRREAAGWT